LAEQYVYVPVSSAALMAQSRDKYAFPYGDCTQIFQTGCPVYPVRKERKIIAEGFFRFWFCSICLGSLGEPQITPMQEQNEIMSVHLITVRIEVKKWPH